MMGKPLYSHLISFPKITSTEGDGDEDTDLRTTFVGMQIRFVDSRFCGRSKVLPKIRSLCTSAI